MLEKNDFSGPEFFSFSSLMVYKEDGVSLLKQFLKNDFKIMYFWLKKKIIFGKVVEDYVS